MSLDAALSLSDISPRGSGAGCSGCTPTAAQTPGSTAAPIAPTTSSTASSVTNPTGDPAMTSTADTSSTARYRVEGMTCGHCVAAVTEELHSLAGVQEVSVELTAGGTSTVTVASNAPLHTDQVTAALAEAGDYHLTATA